MKWIDASMPAKKGSFDWVGAHKDCKNVMHTHLTTKEEPAFDDPDKPTGTGADPVTTAQLEKVLVQTQKSGS